MLGNAGTERRRCAELQRGPILGAERQNPARAEGDRGGDDKAGLHATEDNAGHVTAPFWGLPRTRI